MNVNLMENLFWTLLNGCACAWLMNRIVLHADDERSRRIRLLVWGLLVSIPGVIYSLLVRDPFRYLWIYILILCLSGSVLLSSVYDDEFVVPFSMTTALVIMGQLGTLLMESVSLLFFHAETAGIPLFWKTAARTTDTALVFLAGLGVSEFRLCKIGLGKRYRLRTETEAIIVFFYLLFLCLHTILLPEPWDSLYQNELLLMLPVCPLYLSAAAAYGLQGRKTDLQDTQNLEHTMNVQRQKMRMLEEHTFELSAIRHDFRNVFLTAEQLIAEERIDEAEQLLEGYQESLKAALEAGEEQIRQIRDEKERLNVFEKKSTR